MSRDDSATSLPAGEMLVRALESMGTRHVFGVPGTQTVPLFEALRRSTLNTIVPTHELAASMMAGAYYRICGQPGILFTIPGPGFTYALTGLAEARLDSAALIHFVPSVVEGPDAAYALQAVPQTWLAGALAKAVLLADSADSVGGTAERAREIALSGEPGPVVVQLGGGTDPAMQSDRHGAMSPAGADPDGTSRVWNRLLASKRPVILAGQGCNHDSQALRSFAESLFAPVVTTPSARGVLPEDHPLAMGFDPHRGGIDAANRLLDAADLVLVLGAKLGHNGTAGHALHLDPARISRVDTDEGSLKRLPGTPFAVASTVRQFLSAADAARVRRSDWAAEEVSRHRLAIRNDLRDGTEPRVGAQPADRFFNALQAALPDRAVIVTDTGMHQIMARRHLEIASPSGLLMPTDFQAMGFGLPAAIAAKLADPDRPVVLLIGDGGLAMSGMELATAARLGLSIPVIVFDDGKLNQIRLHQESEFGHGFGVTLPHIDYSALATAMGIPYRDDGDDIHAALEAAFNAALPTLIRVPVADTISIRRNRVVARAKATLRATPAGRWIARLRHRTRGS